jgi:hypothetical protein
MAGGRSQRHKVYIQGVAANGDNQAEGMPGQGGKPSAPAGGPTDITTTPASLTHASNLGNAQQVGTFTGVGGAGPYTFALNINPYGTYFILGNALKILIDPPHVTGVRQVGVRVTDSQQRTFDKSIPVTVT